MIAHRFINIDISKVTIQNYKETLSESLSLQVEIFIPPDGSFDDGCLKRYLEHVKNYEQEDAIMVQPYRGKWLNVKIILFLKQKTLAFGMFVQRMLFSPCVLFFVFSN